MVFLKEFFEKVDFEKKSAEDEKSMKNYPVGKELKKDVIVKVDILFYSLNLVNAFGSFC